MDSLVMRAFSNRVKTAVYEPGPTHPLGAVGYGSSPAHHEYEQINAGGRKQMLKDLIPVVVGTSLGYGITKTIADHVSNNMAANGVKMSPMLRKVAPYAVPALSSAAAYLYGRNQGLLKNRRQEATARYAEEHG